MKIRKKLLSMLLTAALVLSLMPAVTLTALAASDVWDGTSDTTWYNSTDTSFTITTAEEFAGFKDLVNAGNTFSGKTVTLGADIELNDVSDSSWYASTPNAWTMIGSSTYFAGTFNGAGHTVSGVYTSASYTHSGLFGYNSGTVQNLGVVDSYICGIFDVGGVVMTNSGTVSNCYNTGVVSCNAILEDARMTALAAGVVGENSSTGTVTNCYNTGAVTCGMTTEETSGYASGVVGQNEGTVSNCYNTGAVTTSDSSAYQDYSGGVTGYNSGTVSNCYNTGSVSGYLSRTGGVAGGNTGTISNCYSKGSVSGIYTVGGVVGYNYGGTVSICYNTGSVSGAANYAGGVVAHNNGGTVSNCYNTGDVAGYSYAYLGGVVGQNAGTVSYCYSAGAVSGSGSSIGGVAGSNSGTITGCYYDSDTSGVSAGIYGVTDSDGSAMGKTTADMQTETAFTDWDTSVWTFKSGEYPQLKAFVVWDATTDTNWYNDTDTSFTITTAEELAGLRYLVNNGNSFSGKTVTLGADIRLNDVSNVAGWSTTAPANTWTPIGTSSNPFSGTFNGGGYTVSGVYISNTSSYQGLFGYISGGTVRNLGVVSSYISGGSNVGGVAGYIASGTVTGCCNTGIVAGSGSYVGGVTGYNAGTVTNCYNTGDVTGGDTVGGVTGSNASTVSYCYSAGAVSGSGSSIGGVAGSNSGTITGCYYDSDVCSVGGISDYDVSGSAEGKTTAEMQTETAFTGWDTSVWCFLSGGYPQLWIFLGDDTTDLTWYTDNSAATDFSVGTAEELAGLRYLVNIGITFSGKTVTLTADIELNDVSDSSWYTTGPDSWTAIGTASHPFSGTFNGGGHTVSGVYIIGESSYQGLFGYISGGTVRNLGVVSGYITGDSYVGGVAGYIASGTVTGCCNTGDVTGSGSNVGGVAGYIASGTVTGCCNTGDVTGSGSSVGGVAGYMNSGSTIISCYNMGKIVGKTDFGGVVGFNLYGTVTDCYNTGRINANRVGNMAGGVVGLNAGTVSYCYNTGFLVTDEAAFYQLGGVVGCNNSSGNVTNCYNTGNISIPYYNGATHLFGGVVGDNDGTVSYCYNTGNISGSGQIVGGVAGDNDGTVSYCYSAGSVAGYSTIGSVVGSGSTTGCYYDKQLCTASGSTGLLTSELATGTAFSSWSSDVWNFTDGLYPRLTGYVDGTTDYEMDTTDAAYLSASPVTLASTETVASVSTDFSVSTENSVSWSSSSSGLDIASDGAVTISAGGTNVVLTATRGGFSKSVTLSSVVAYTISAIDDQTLTDLTAGYASGSQETKTITITRTGNGDLKNLAVTLGGTNSGSFTITQPSDTTLDDTTTSTTFTIKANDSLSAGSYTATVTVSADNMKDVTFDVGVTVFDAAPTYSASVDPTSKTFTAAEAGYSEQTAQEFTIENTGTGNLTNLSATLGGSNFEISTALSSDAIATGSGTATVSVRPVTGLSEGTYTDTLTITGDNGITLEVSLSFTVSAATTYTATVDPTSKTFTAAEVSYGTQTAQEFTITNTGTGNLTNLSAALGSGTNFEISTALSDTSVASNGTATVSVRPVTGLSEGTYTDTLTITGDNGITLEVSLSFTVSAATTYTATVDPTSKTFTAATVSYGTQTAQEFTITNTGTGNLTNLNAALTSGTNFEISTALSDTSVASNGTATVSVRPVTGLSEGTYTDTLTITGDNGITLTVSLSFTVSAATTYTATVTPTSKTFTAATVSYGTQTAQEFTITNTGTGSITSLSAALGGTNFEISIALSGSTITSGSTATVSVRPVTGLSVGTYTDTLTITGDNGITLTVSLSFTVSAATTYTATVDPTSKTFTAAEAGYSEQTAQEFTIENTGTGTLTGLSAALTSGTNFEISTALSDDSITSGNTATVSVRPVTGLSVGTYTDTLTITGDNSISLTVNLSFTVSAATTYTATVTPTSKTFTAAEVSYGTQTAQEFTITNTGTGSITSLSASLGDSNFEISTALSGDSITSGNTATVSVRPKTGLSVGTYTDTLTITGDNSISLTVNLSFTVNAATTYTATVTPTSKTFTAAEVSYGTQTAQEFTISNTGTGTLTNLSAALTSGTNFEISTALSDTTAASGGTVTVSVRPVTGLSEGTYTDTLTITGDNNISLTVNLSFTVSAATTYTATVDPTSKTFTAAEAGYSEQTAQEFTIENTGTGTLTGLSAALTSGTNFEISTVLSGDSITSGGTATVSARPVTGLSVGTYTDTLTITGDNGISLTVDLSFTVSAATTYTATVTPTSKTFTAAEVSYGTQTAQEFTIENTGTGTLTNLSAALTSGTNFEISTALSGDSITSGNTATVSVRPVTGLAVGTYTDTLTITGDNGINLTVNLSFTVNAATTYTATVTPTSKTFTAATVSYGTQTAQEFTITNTGTGTLTNLSAALGGSNFEISTALAASTITSGNTATVSVRPVTGLSVGTYTDTLTITGDNSISLTVNLSFTVSAENPSSYTITASTGSGGSISPSGSVSVSSGGSQTFTITPSSNYSISSVTVDSVSQGAISTYTFSNVSGNHTISATFTYTGGSSGGSTGGSSSGNTQTSYSATMSGDSSGKLTVTVDEDAGSASAALSDAQGKLISGGKDLAITMPVIDDMTDYILGIPVSSLSSDSGNGSLTLNTGAGSVTIPSNMLTGTDAASGDTAKIEIGLVDSSELSDEARNAVGDRPVVSLTLYIDAAQTDWSNPDAPVTVSIPYTPADGEDLNAIVVWYIDGDGNLNCVQNGHYDSETGTVTFQTTHFSLYAVGYNGVSFTDVADTAWYYDAVSYLAARRITTGTSDTTFSPTATLTRGQFITLLLRAYNIEAIDNAADNFSDAGDTYYTGYLAAAKVLGISNGVGDNKFAPEQAITRQEMFTLLFNALKVLDRLPQGDSGKALSDFADIDSVADWAEEAMTLLVETGTVSGSGSKLNPTGITTRAEMAQVLYNLLKG